MPPETGDLAPNFDLTSTAGPVLMLRDEVTRTPVLLYLFRGEASERVRADLRELARLPADLIRRRVRPLAVSDLSLPALAALQAELRLPFPLLHDDRNLTAAYRAAGDEAAAEPALLLVGRDQRIVWAADPVAAVGPALAGLPPLLARLAPLAAAYPRAVVNSFVARLVGRG